LVRVAHLTRFAGSSVAQEEEEAER